LETRGAASAEEKGGGADGEVTVGGQSGVDVDTVDAEGVVLVKDGEGVAKGIIEGFVCIGKDAAAERGIAGLGGTVLVVILVEGVAGESGGWDKACLGAGEREPGGDFKGAAVTSGKKSYKLPGPEYNIEGQMLALESGDTEVKRESGFTVFREFLGWA